MRQSENCYCFEMKARRDGYEKHGFDGVQLPAGNAKKGVIPVSLPLYRPNCTPSHLNLRIPGHSQQSYRRRQPVPLRVSVPLLAGWALQAKSSPGESSFSMYPMEKNMMTYNRAWRSLVHWSPHSWTARTRGKSYSFLNLQIQKTPPYNTNPLLPLRRGELWYQILWILQNDKRSSDVEQLLYCYSPLQLRMGLLQVYTRRQSTSNTTTLSTTVSINLKMLGSGCSKTCSIKWAI